MRKAWREWWEVRSVLLMWAADCGAPQGRRVLA